MKTKFTLSALFLCLLSWQFATAQVNIKVKVLSVAVTTTADCDAGAGDNSDFVFEYKVQDNSPSAFSNNTPVAGSIGMCNYASVAENNGPFSYSPVTPGPAVFSPATGLFFDRTYNCKYQVPTSLTLTWRAYENDDASTPSTVPTAGGLISAQVSTYTIPSSNGTYTTQYTQTSSDGSCPQTYSIEFEVEKTIGTFSPLEITFADGGFVCNGATNGGLEASTSGGSGTVLYDWSFDGLSDYANELNEHDIAAGTYTLVVKDALNCTDTITATITAIAPPSAIGLFTTFSTTVCTGQSGVAYEVSSQSGVVYNWNYSGAGAAITGSGNAVSVNFLNFATSGTLSVFAQNSCSVSPTVTLDITVTASPVVSISGNVNMCGNSEQVLTASGATSYTWVPGINTSTLSISPSTATVYTVNASDNGCFGTQQFTVEVLATPTVQISGSTVAVCPNQPVALNASGNGGLFIWSDGFIGANHTVHAPSTTVYMVTNTFTNNCFAQSTFTVNILAGPQTAVSGNTLVCKNVPVNLTASGADTYVWSDGSTATTYSFLPVFSTTIGVVGTATNGCKDSIVKTITVLQQPVVSISGPDTICEGQFALLTANSTGTVTYGWNSGANTQTINVSPVSNFTYNVTAFNGACSASASHEVVVKLIPAIDFTIPSPVFCTTGSAYTFTADPSGGIYSGIGVSGDQFSPSVGVGIYYVTYEVGVNNGCIASKTQSLEVVVCTGVDNISADANEFKVFPNPATTDITVLSDKIISSVFVYDFTGKLVRIIETQSLQESVDISELSKGLYTVTVMFNDKTTLTTKVVKQ